MVDAAGVRFHVAEAGTGEPVLLVHDWAQHWYAWRRVIPLLAPDHRVLAVDLRGAGWSDAPATGYTTEAGVADLIGVLDALGIRRATIVGHGWGGTLALHLAIRHPDRVDALVLAGTAGPWVTARSMLNNACWYVTTIPYETPFVGRFVAQWFPWLLRAVLRRSAHDREPLTRAALDTYTEALREPARAAAAEKVQRHRGYGEVVPTLLGKYRSRRLSVPTVMLVGDHDPGLSERACATALSHADDLVVTVVRDCGHLVPEERPDAIARAVRG